MFILSKPYSQVFLAPFGGGEGSGDGEEKENTEPTPESVEFHKRFAASREGGMAGAVPPPDPKPKDGEEEHKEDEAKKPPLFQKKPGSNVPKIIEEKRKAEAEREEFRTKAEKFEKEEKPALEKKITDLEAQIAESGHTKKEREELQIKLEATEKKLEERESSLVNENKELKSRLAFQDIQQDPEFQQEFVKPIATYYTEAVDTFQGDEPKMALLRKALLANSAALSSNKPEERLAQERERNTVLSQIADSLDEFSRGQFTQAMNAYIRATKAHAVALGKHEETRAEILKKRGDAASEARTRIFKTWTDTSSTIAPSYDPDTVLDGELAEAAKELKLAPTDEVKSLGETLSKVITGRAGMEESLDLLHKGRVYPVLKAKVAAQDHLIKGLRATIQKLRGAKPAGEGKDGRESETKKETLSDFNSRFRASRPGTGYRGAGGGG